MPNDLLVTTTDILGIEVAKDYSGASGIYVDNVNNIISITGDVGKEYNGIEPIVVNNEENLISANSAPIGVQEPLYFVQDDDEAVIIGLSGEYVTPSDIAGKLDTSSFESWQQGQYTNDLTAINEKINEVSSNIPSIEGLATEQLVEETSASIVSQIPSTAGLASETYVQEQVSGKVSKSDLESVSGDIVNLIPDVSNFYTKDETSGASQLAEAFSQIGPGGDEEVNALVHSNSGTWNTVTGKLDTTAFSDVSGTFLTAHQSLSNFYTKDETSGKEELANAFANVPAGDSEVNSYVHNNSASIDESTGLVQSNSSTWNDVTVYQSNSASYLTAHQSLDGYATQDWVTAQGYLTGVSIPDSATWNEVSTAYQNASATYLTAHQDISNKLDTTAFSDVSGSFLTAVNIPESATWEDVSDVVQSNSAQWGQGGGGLTGNYVSGYNVVVKPDDVPGEWQPIYYSAVEVSGDVKLKTWFVYSGHEDFGPYDEKGYSLYDITQSTANWNNVSDSYRNISANILTNSPKGTIKTEGHKLEATNSAVSGDTYTITPEMHRVYVSALPGYPYNKYTITPINDRTVQVLVNYGTSEWEMYGHLDYDDILPHDLPVTSGGKDLMWVEPFNCEIIAGEEQVVELATKSDLPTYEYDSSNKISAINGSALAGGGDFVPQSAFDKLKQSYDALSSLFATYSGQWLLPNEGV